MEDASQTLSQHEERMIPTHIIGPTVFHQSVPDPLGRPGVAMVLKVQFGKTSRLPIQHIRLHFVHGVPAWRRPKPTDCLPTFAPVDLCCAAHVERRTWFKSLNTVVYITDDAASNPKARIAPKMVDALLKIFRSKRQVAVHLDDEFPIITGERAVAIVKGFHNTTASLAEAAIAAMNCTNPRMLGSILVDDASGAIC